MSRTLTKDDLAEFKTRVCDIAEAMFAERGAENVSMRQIAEALGVSPMTPYRYFENREEILTSVRIRGFEHFASELEHAYARADGGSKDKTIAACKAYVDFALSRPHTYRLMFEVQQLGDRDDSVLGRAVARARATLSRYGDSLIASGANVIDARDTESLIWSSLHGAVMLELAGKLAPGTARRMPSLLGVTAIGE